MIICMKHAQSPNLVEKCHINVQIFSATFRERCEKLACRCGFALHSGSEEYANDTVTSEKAIWKNHASFYVFGSDRETQRRIYDHLSLFEKGTT